VSIRVRLTAWFTGLLFISLAAMSVFSYRELVAEPRSKANRPGGPTKVEADEDGGQDVLVILAWCGLPALALALGGGWWMMRRALAPVAALTRAAETITEHHLGERLPLTGAGDELDRLTEVFNAMTGRLEGSFLRIREFTLHASHELKTPLTVMHGEIETELEQPDLTPGRRERLLSQLNEVQRLSRIVDGLTLLTKADAGQVRLQLAPVSLTELVRDSFTDARLLGQDAGLNVELGACDQTIVQGDAHRLRQVLLNLADNAVKYNQPGGSVRMSLRCAGDAAEFAIANTGKGIPADLLPRVFDRFFRGDAAHSQEVEGCGLGLSIAQWIVQAHGGAIRLESEPAKWTTVTVRLPLMKGGDA
jgi:signal transduction histidine kinase